MSQSPSDESPDEDSVLPFIIISLTEDKTEEKYNFPIIESQIYLNKGLAHVKQNSQK